MNLKGIFQKSPPWKKSLLLIWFVCISFIITYILSIVTAYVFWGSSVFNTAFLTDLSNPDSISVMKYIQSFNSLGMFLIPAVLLSWMAFPGARFCFWSNTKVSLFKYFLAVVLALSMLPVSNLLGELNQMVSFPDSLSGVEAFLRNSEKNAEQLTHTFISADNLSILFLNLFVIAVIPAIAEEFFFRGALQKIFVLWIKNAHVAIFVTAFIFSVIHFQFFSFVPRLFLGMVFGYLMYYTGNIWIPVIAHFVNNAAAVIVYYLITNKTISPDTEHIGDSSTITWFISGIIIAFTSYYFICRKPQGKLI